MEKKFLSKAVMYRCTELSWWNDGTERKPNKADFDNLQFELLKNHNMKWVSLFNIELTIPREYEFNFFKLEYTAPSQTDPVIEYYYVEKVLDINSRNKKMLLTLDIWCTYIISKLPVKDNQQLYNLEVQTNRFLFRNPNCGDLTNLKPISPYGFLTNNSQIEQSVKWLRGDNAYKNGIWNNCDINFIKNQNSFIKKPASPVFNPLGVYKYYVFLTENIKENIEMSSGGLARSSMNISDPDEKHVVLIPVLFKWSGNFVASNIVGDIIRKEDNKFVKHTDRRSSWVFKRNNNFKDDIHYPNPNVQKNWESAYHLFNDEYNLIRLAERVNEHKGWSGLSKFLGVHYGENFFKFISKVENDSFVSNSDKSLDSNYFFAAPSAGAMSPLIDIKPDNFVCLDVESTFDQNQNKSIMNLKGFACARIKNSGIKLYKPENYRDDYLDNIAELNLQNMYILGDDSYPFQFGDKRVYFTDRFVVTNGKETYEMNSEIPLILDDYYNTLQATKPQRDAALRSAIGNLATSAIRDWLPPSIHGQGVYAEKTARGKYWEDAGLFYGSSGYLKSLKNTKFGENPIEPWSGIAFKNSASYEQNVLSKNYKDIGKSDKFMGKVSKGLGVLSSIGTAIGSTIQFANTLYGLKAQQQQLRLQISSSLTSTSSSFLNKHFFIEKHNKEIKLDGYSSADATMIMSNWVHCDHLLGFPTEDKYFLREYYGIETNYKDLTISIKDLLDNWIVMSDGEMLFRNFYQLYKHILRNDIIEAIVKMLTQGVRVLPKP